MDPVTAFILGMCAGVVLAAIVLVIGHDQEKTDETIRTMA